MDVTEFSVPDSQRGLRQIWRLLKADYYRGYSYKEEDERRMRLLMLPRMLTNTSLHANFLVRLMIGTPAWMAYLWRRLLISWHSMDVARDVVIGPGLELPHPIGILIGARTRIGADVCIHHCVSVGPARGRWYPGDPRQLTIGDGVVIFPFTHVQADIGDGATIANHTYVAKEVPAGSTAAGAPARIVRQAGQARDAASNP